MEALFGIVGKDFVLTAADNLSVRSIVVMKKDENKTKQLNDHVLMLYTGEPGHTVQFSDFIQRHVQLYHIQQGAQMSTKSAANFTRSELAKSFRKGSTWQVNMLIAGHTSEEDGPQLYWTDYLGALDSVPFAVQGYASHFCLATMDRFYRPNMTLEEATFVLKKCINELKQRFVVNFSDFNVQVIDRSGIRQLKI